MATLSTVTSMSSMNMFKLVTMFTAQIRVRPAVSATNQAGAGRSKQPSPCMDPCSRLSDSDGV